MLGVSGGERGIINEGRCFSRQGEDLEGFYVSEEKACVVYITSKDDLGKERVEDGVSAVRGRLF